MFKTTSHASSIATKILEDVYTAAFINDPERYFKEHPLLGVTWYTLGEGGLCSFQYNDPIWTPRWK